MDMLKIEHVSKKFGDVEVLKDISLSVSEGETVALIGPSGSGKTTLLRCATDLDQPTSGNIIYAERPAANPPFGLVFQNYNLFPHFSVLKNITAAQTAVLKRPVNEAERIARELLAKVGLESKASAYPCELSGGQQQRVAIARALAMNPQVLFFDEPTAALDPELVGDILKVIRDLAAAKMTMVIVTHEISFARDVADRIVFMAGGVVVETGPARELVENPKEERTRAFLARFLNA